MSKLTLAVATLVTTGLVMSANLSGQSASTRAWSPPRTSDGQPDIQGFWREVEGQPSSCNLETSLCGGFTVEERATEARMSGVTRDLTEKPVSAIVDPPDGKIPYQEWAAARRAEIRKTLYVGGASSLRMMGPEYFCILGVPRLHYFPEAQIVQAPGHIVVSWERTGAYRVIPLGERLHAPSGVKLLMGDARGHWEGSTLVVDTRNMNDWSWLDAQGNFHSDAMSMVERFTIADANTIHYQATIDDPKVYTRPWTMAFSLKRSRPPSDGYEFLEYGPCVDPRYVDQARGIRE